MITRRTSVRGLAIAGLLGVALAPNGCGSDAEPSDETHASGGSPAVTDKSPEPMSDRQQIVQSVAEMQDAFTAGRGKAYCDMLTTSGQAEIVRAAKVLAVNEDDCASIVTTIVARSPGAAAAQPPSRVLSVRVRGHRAVAVIRIANRFSTKSRFVKDGGEWQLVSPGLEDALKSNRKPSDPLTLDSGS